MAMSWSPGAQLALDTLAGRPTSGTPSWLLNIMDHGHLERLAGSPPGSYRDRPVEVYLAAQQAIGTCLLDQWIPENPLSIGAAGYEGAARGATTGLDAVTLDGLRIDSPEAVVQHLEQHALPQLAAACAAFDEPARAAAVRAHEQQIQALFGPDIVKGPYGCASFPCFAYGTYGYAPYFMAYALYPEVMERHFALQADLALRNNRAVAQAIVGAGLPRLIRLDHDMADSRGTLADVRSLDRLWFPHFARCLEPLLAAGITLIWHCDGNLMAMVPRLLEVGLGGFQGFQYEDGMDYERICRLKRRDGEDLVIIAGVSVTTTLPHGRPDDVRRELAWLVEHGAGCRLFLGASSSIAPGVPWDNLATLVAGLRRYQTDKR